MRKLFIMGTVCIVQIVAIVVMIGWFFDIQPLLSISPGLATMKFTTALSFSLSSFILLFSHQAMKKTSDLAIVVIPTASLAIWIIMATILVSSVFGFTSGLENLFVREKVGDIVTYVPGRPSLGTIVGFLLITFLGLCVFSEWKLKKNLFLTSSVLITCIGGLSILGYMFSVPIFYYTITGISNAMAVHTAILFVLIGISFGLL